MEKKNDKISTILGTIVLIAAFAIGEIASADLLHKISDNPNPTMWMMSIVFLGPMIALGLMTLAIKTLEAFTKLLRRPE